MSIDINDLNSVTLLKLRPDLWDQLVKGASSIGREKGRISERQRARRLIRSGRAVEV
jgi:hypothetical protein